MTREWIVLFEYGDAASKKLFHNPNVTGALPLKYGYVFMYVHSTQLAHYKF